MESWLGLPIFAVVVYSTFAFLMFAIRSTELIKSDDKKGINWFIAAFSLWGLNGIIQIITIRLEFYNYPNVVPPKITTIEAFISTLNSYCFLKASRYIQIISDYRGKKIVRDITNRNNLILITGIILILTLLFYFKFRSDYESFKQWIWVPDTLISLIALFILVIVISQAFWERGMRWFILLNAGVFILLLISVFIKIWFIYTLPPHIDYMIIIYPVYKTVFFVLILLLLFSYQIKEYKTLKSEKSDFLEFNLHLEEENRNLQGQIVQQQSLVDELIREKNDLVNEFEQKEKDLATKFAEERKIPVNLTEPAIEFVIRGDQYYIIIIPELSRERIEIQFAQHLKPFKQLLRLAIHHKFGKNADQTLTFSDEIKKKETENDPKLEQQYNSQFTYWQKKSITDIISKDYPKFEDDFLKVDTNTTPHRIGFRILSDNIFLPKIETGINTLPKNIYQKFLDLYPVLNRERGLRAEDNPA